MRLRDKGNDASAGPATEIPALAALQKKIKFLDPPLQNQAAAPPLPPLSGPDSGGGAASRGVAASGAAAASRGTAARRGAVSSTGLPLVPSDS